MASRPTVSVITPVYNGAAYLSAMIESVLGQSYADFEFLIIDDGSTDNAPAIIADHAARDRRIRFVRRENRGVTATLNELLHQARGEFIAQADNDDISAPDRLARQVAFLRRRPDVVCLSGAFHLIDHHGRYLTTLQVPEEDGAIQRLLLQGHSSIWHACAMSRRSALTAVGGWDERYQTACDLDLWLRLGEVGRLANLPQPLVKYRLHAGSNSGARAAQQRREGREATERAWQRRGILDGVYAANAQWRPGPDRASQHHFMLKFGWWAYEKGQRQTALLYALRAVQKQPWALGGWNLLRCAATKTLPAAVEPGW